MMIKKKIWSQVSCAATATGCVLSTTSALASGTASALIREGDAVTLSGASGTVSSINNTAVNHADGYAVTVNVDTPAATISTVYGNASGGMPMLLREESLIGDLDQTSFESFFGISNAGNISYSPTSTRVSTNTTGLDGVWLDDTIQAIEEDPAPGGAAGEFTSFGSRPGVTADGRAYWVGGVTDTVGGGSLDRTLYFDGVPLISGGDDIGVTELVTVGGGIDFDFRFSALGTHYISPIDVQSSSLDDLVITINGTVIAPGGNDMREGTPMPLSVGGDGVENWDNFDFVDINEAGDYFVTGDSDASISLDEFVVLNGAVVLREGDQVGGLTLSGSIEGGVMNEDADWAVVWDVDSGGDNLETLIINGEAVLTENDAVDWNGDGVIDAADMGFVLTDFSGISSLTLSDRSAGDVVTAYFTADATDASGNTLEGAFSVDVVVPEPTTGTLAVLAVLTGLRRRR